MDTLYIIVPCYNEEETLPSTISKLTELLLSHQNKLWSSKSKILLVDDGSKDSTWEIIDHESQNNQFVKGIRLTRNSGHQNALLCGIKEAVNNCDLCISIDADLQDDISVIPEMVRKYHDGSDLVCGVRKNRKTDTFMKRTTAQIYYKLLKLLGVNIIYNHADYRLMSHDAMSDILAYDESNLFLRGIIPLLGRNIDTVEYDRQAREKGESKYTLGKMLKLSVDGITSFSIVPIRLIFLTGLSMILICIGIIIYSIVVKLQGESVPGWTSLMMSIWIGIGLIMTSIGIVGEYIGKIYLETKRRPKYQIWERTKDKEL